MGPSGFEPLTSSVSGKRSPPELRARSAAECTYRGDAGNRTRVKGFADPCLTTRPRRHAPANRHGRTGREVTERHPGVPGPGAEDGARTRDLNLGKVALYQLSYFRAPLIIPVGPGASSAGQAPVDPKPPSPRSERGNSADSTICTAGTATTTS